MVDRGVRGEPVGRHGGDDVVRDVLRAPAHARGRTGDAAHARGDARAVAEREVARRLDRVADGVAEVQDLAEPALALVRVHHVALDLDVAADHVREVLAVEALGVDGMRRQAAEQRLVADDAVLDDLAARVREELRGERVEAVDVRDDERRLEERAGQVLAGLEVDGRLPADRGVHHGQKRRGHLHDLASAQVQCRGEPAHVTGDAAADRDDDVVARKLRRGEALEQVREGG